MQPALSPKAQCASPAVASRSPAPVSAPLLLGRRAALAAAAAAAAAALAPAQSALAFGSGFPGYDINLDGRKRAFDRNKREMQAELERGECSVFGLLGGGEPDVGSAPR
jgi:hypothetical protein